jgi:DNA-binding NarL/FixJ family response regulator
VSCCATAVTQAQHADTKAQVQGLYSLGKRSVGFEKVGAVRQADRADALLRSLGERGRVGPKGVGRLTRRELEVLELLSEGLTNAEIAQRLFISTKTAGNHVSNILMKLNLRSRTEAAAHVLRLGPDT